MQYPPDFLLSRLLYRDAMILVVDKPAGLPVHAGPKGGENLEMYLDALRFGLPRVPSLAHRLDRETSGCLILGRHRKALARLGKMFETGRIEKTYWAIVRGRVTEESGTVEVHVRKRSTQQRGWWMETCKASDEGALKTLTHWHVKAQNDDHTLLELHPKTGRTHQIRVHCAHLGHPIVGDPVYGIAEDKTSNKSPLMLHAQALKIPLYPSKNPIEIQAVAPETIKKLASAFIKL